MIANVLVVDDVQDTADSLVRSISKAGHEAVAVYSQKAAFDALSRSAFDVVVTDMKMEEDDSGLRVLERAKQLDPSIEGIVLTAYGAVENAVSAMKLGAFDYVEKTTESYGEKDVYDIITDLVNHCVSAQQTQATHQVIFKSEIQPAFRQRVEVLREQKADSELFVDDEFAQVYVAGREVEVQELPYRILIYLMENQGALRSPLRLYSDVWDDPDDYVWIERNPRMLQDRVKTRITDLRRRLELPTIQIVNRNRRYGLSVPDGVDYCLIKESLD
jgi:DNA-binding response OmpR family regulator